MSKKSSTFALAILRAERKTKIYGRYGENQSDRNSFCGTEEQINLLQLDKSGIRVAQYLTELPSKEVLLRQLQKSLAAAKELSTDR